MPSVSYDEGVITNELAAGISKIRLKCLIKTSQKKRKRKKMRSTSTSQTRSDIIVKDEYYLNNTYVNVPLHHDNIAEDKSIDDNENVIEYTERHTYQCVRNINIKNSNTKSKKYILVSGG